MKILLTLFFSLFIFNSFSKANDISEFEIEGLSVNDNLIDIFLKIKLKIL